MSDQGFPLSRSSHPTESFIHPLMERYRIFFLSASPRPFPSARTSLRVWSSCTTLRATGCASKKKCWHVVCRTISYDVLEKKASHQSYSSTSQASPPSATAVQDDIVLPVQWPHQTDKHHPAPGSCSVVATILQLRP